MNRSISWSAKLLRSLIDFSDRLFSVLNNRVTYQYLEGYLRWIAGYPLLSGQIFLYLAIAWGLLGSELGLPELFWHERALEQFWVGLAVCWLFGIVIFLNYLLHRPENLPGLPKDVEVVGRFWFTLFPSRDPGIRQVGRRVAVWLVALLIVLLSGKWILTLTLDHDSIATAIPHYGWPLVLGYSAGVLMAFLISYLDHVTGFRDELAEQGWIHRPFDTDDWHPPQNPFDTMTLQRLHAMAAFVFLISCLILLGVILAAAWGLVLSPAVVFSIVLIVLDGAAGFIAYRIRSHRTLGVLVVLFLLAINSQWFERHKSTFPNLDYPPQQFIFFNSDSGLPVQDYPNFANQATAPARPTHLVKTDECLTGFLNQNPPKPKMVLIAVSGGGIRAAVWTAVVLEQLEQIIGPEEFRQRVRLMAGASGGMVGAASYVGDFANGPLPTTSPRLSEVLAEESLSPVIQTMLLRDFGWNALIPYRFATDRGRTLEETWDRNFQKLNYRGTGESPLAKPIYGLAPQEKAGACPSLIFSPMMVEDARRLLISNLDLKAQTEPKARGFHEPANALGLPSLEFSRLFPTADQFRLGTAARMSASFPVISPAVSLPLNPVRRLVDAGFYDNYGVDLLANWLLTQQNDLRPDRFGGIVLIQIRAYPLEEPGRTVGQVPQSMTDKLVGAVNAPAEALLNARSWSAYHRNNDLLAELDRHFNTKATPDFFTTLSFEFDGEAALNWYLPQNEKQAIWTGFSDVHKAEAAKLKSWLIPTTKR